MITKEAALTHKTYKQIFLLAFARFLTYEEMEQYDILQPYELALANKELNKIADWPKLMLDYTEDNVKKALCIDMNIAANDVVQNDAFNAELYADDIVEWLHILEDNEIQLKSYKHHDIIDFFNEVAKKYKYEIHLNYEY